MTGMTGARLVAGSGQFAGLAHSIDGEATIGRNADNDVVLDLPILSGRHARVYSEAGTFYLEDLDSRNGTRLDGVRVSGRVRLDHLHVVTLADAVDLVFVRENLSVRPPQPPQSPQSPPRADAPPAPAAAAAPPPSRSASYDTQAITAFDVFEIPAAQPSPPPPSHPTTPPAVPVPSSRADDTGPAPTAGSDDERQSATRYDLDFSALIDPRSVEEPPRPTPAVAHYDLVLVLPDGRQQVYQLKSGENVLGRSSECDVVLPDPDQWLSRRHAILSVEPDSIRLADNGTVNGTFVREARIPSTAIPIDVGTTFRLGPHLVLTLVRR